MNIRNKTSVLAVAVALVAAFIHPASIYPASADQQLTKKWFPGHYIRAYRAAPDQPINNASRNLVVENPGFVGYGIQFDWRDLETSFGVYDFSRIVADLDEFHAIGKKASLQVNERTYYKNATGTCGNAIAGPDYLRDDLIYQGGYFESKDPGRCKWIPKFYVQSVAERFVAMWQALALAIDDHPALAYVSTQESAIPGTHLVADFDSTAYFNNFMYMNSAIADAFPNTIFTPMLNFESALNSTQVNALIVHLATVKKTGITDPGLFKKNTNVLVKPFAAMWRDYRGVIPLAAGTENKDYTISGGAESAQAVYDFGVDTVGLNFHLWTVVRETEPDINFHIGDVIDVLTAENFRINTTPPKNLLVGGGILPFPENLRIISD